VTLQRPHLVTSSVDDSTLFQHLDSSWCLQPGPTPDSTWLAFRVDFAFRSQLYGHVADVFFSEVVQRMMGAFEQRCQQLYGQSSLQRASQASQQQRQQQQVQQQA
jgi:ribosome-associated toxin RatA of RatAB toxin-antitoxin module